MGKKAKSKFNYGKDRRRAWKQTKKLPFIGSEPIRKCWDEKKSIKSNLEQMGLSVDPNKTLRIPTSKEMMNPVKKEKKKRNIPDSSKTGVVKELEDEANTERESTFKLADETARFCKYMLDKYKDGDYKAMCKDERNYYQETPKQIQRKINLYKKHCL